MASEADKIVEMLNRPWEDAKNNAEIKALQIRALNQLASLRGGREFILEEIELIATRFDLTVDQVAHEMDKFLGIVSEMALDDQIDIVTASTDTVEIARLCEMIASIPDELRAVKITQRLAKRVGVETKVIQRKVSEARKALIATGKQFLDEHKPGRETEILLQHPSIASAIKAETSFVYAAETLWRYRDGVYVADGEMYVRQQTKQIIEKIAKDAEEKAKANGETFDATPILARFTADLVEKVVFDIATDSLTPIDALNGRTDVINLRNGLLRWETGELLTHDPAVLSTVQLPLTYDLNADCPLTKTFWKEVIPADAIPVAEEWIGYCVLPTTKMEKALMLLGGGQNGKSTFIKQLMAFIGRANYSTEPLQALDEDKFAAAELHGKLVNAFADLPSRALEDTGMFKSLVTGDEIMGQKKFQQPFSFKPFARLVFSANTPPSSRDNSRGFWRRWLTISFPNEISDTKKDEDLIDKLTSEQEMSGLLNIAIAGLQRLVARGHFEEVASIRETLDAYRQVSDPVMAFLREECLVDPRMTAHKDALYQTYRQWCDESGHRALSRQKFNGELLAKVPGLRLVRLGEKGNGIRAWQGLGLLDGEAEEVATKEAVEEASVQPPQEPDPVPELWTNNDEVHF